MYLTIKQQLKHLTKDNYLNLKELCHVAKNLTNECIYNVRQYYFNEREYLCYEKNYHRLPQEEQIIMRNKIQSIINTYGKE